MKDKHICKQCLCYICDKTDTCMNCCDCHDGDSSISQDDKDLCDAFKEIE